MKEITYIGELLPDGHISIPDEVRKELEQYELNNLKITIAFDSLDEKKGWDVFRQMGKHAEPGTLPNASENHDLYLYGKAK
jgi:hypothetical protein